jgi:dipeptidyl aminopeptidase/acylaminoacyl peptidase
MSIAFLREGSYPGSDIVIVKELAAGSNYRRYYAYYLSEGLKIYALLTVPYGDPPAGGFPAIVFNHGYIPPDIYRTTERYIAYVDRLARSGYVVFRIDYRGNDKSEGVARGAYGDPGYTIDVLNAVASIKRYPRVNPEKIGMWGHSMGGFLTLRAMVISKDIKVGVIWSGVVASYPEMLYNWKRTGDFTPSPSSSGAGWRDGWLETYGTPEQNPVFWASISANSYLADLSGPLQLHHGTGDEDVPLDFSIRLAEQIRAVGGTTELYTYENDNHNITKYFNLAMDRTIAFFDHILKTQPS